MPTVGQPAASAPLVNDPPADTAAPQVAAGPSSGPAEVVNDRPEIAVGGAFAGGLVFALILKRLAR
jgi:hypothetical protein